MSDVAGAGDAVFDGVEGTTYYSSASQCYIGIDVGEGLTFVLKRIRFFPFSKWLTPSNNLKNAKF